MAKTIIIDEIHLTVRVPNDVRNNRAETICRTLAGDDFMNRLRRAVRAVFREFPELNVARLSLDR